MKNPTCPRCGRQITEIYYSTLTFFRASVRDGRVEWDGARDFSTSMPESTEEPPYWLECSCGAFLIIHLNVKGEIEEVTIAPEQ